MYADKITDSMQKTINETQYRRNKQIAFNKKNNITPRPLNKPLENDLQAPKKNTTNFETASSVAIAQKEVAYFTKEQLQKRIKQVRKNMEAAAKELDFMEAAKYRDMITAYQEKLEQLKIK